MTGRILLRLFLGLWRLTGWAAGCFLFCKKKDFEAVGGFDERYYASEEIHLSRALKRRGPFRILRTPVLTSGRKFRLYDTREQWRTLFHLAIGGMPATRQREGLDLWYDGRRETTKQPWGKAKGTAQTGPNPPGDAGRFPTSQPEQESDP